MAEERRQRIGDEHQAQQQEHTLGVAVGAEEDQRPDHDGGDRDREIARHAEELERARDARELGHHEAEVGHGEADDREEREPQGELLADEGGEPLAGEDGEAGDHLLDDHVGDRHEDDEEQGAVAELRPRRGVGGHAAGVVPGARGDDAGPEGAQIEREAAPPAPSGQVEGGAGGRGVRTR